MKWKFWKKDKIEDDETIIKITKTIQGTEVYVCAKSSKKTLDIYRKLKKELKSG